MTRLFYGIELPAACKSLLGTLQQNLKQGLVDADGWSNPALFHLTVLFLGVVDDSLEQTWIEAGNTAVEEIPSFSLRLGRLGLFPKNKVLWVGLDTVQPGMVHLNNLHEEIQNQVAARVAFPLDTRPYRPHLTLARKVRRAGRVEESPCTVEGLEFSVDALCLFESTRMDDQLVYPVRHRFNLRGNSPVQTT